MVTGGAHVSCVEPHRKSCRDPHGKTEGGGGQQSRPAPSGYAERHNAAVAIEKAQLAAKALRTELRVIRLPYADSEMAEVLAEKEAESVLLDVALDQLEAAIDYIVAVRPTAAEVEAAMDAQRAEAVECAREFKRKTGIQ